MAVEERTHARARTQTGKSRAVFAGSLLVAGMLLAISLRGVNLHALVAALRAARPGFVMLAACTLSVSYFARGYRWRIQIGAAAPISALTAFWITMTSYLANNLLPLRAGEIVRPLIASRVTGITASYALATVFVEHVADIVALVLLSAVAAIAQVAIPGWLRTGAASFALLGLMGTAGLLVLVRIEPALDTLLPRLPIPATMTARIHAILRRFILGARSLQSPRVALGYLSVTALVWLLDVVTGMAIAWALRVLLTWPQMLLLLVALSLTSAAPSTPANIGVWQVVAVALLEPFGVSHVYALAYILVFQVVTYGIETLWGVLGLLGLAKAHPSVSGSLLRGPDEDAA